MKKKTVSVLQIFKVDFAFYAPMVALEPGQIVSLSANLY